MKFQLFIILAMSMAVSCSKKESSSTPNNKEYIDKLVQEKVELQEKARTRIASSGSRLQAIEVFRDRKAGIGEMMVAGELFFKSLPMMNLPSQAKKTKKNGELIVDAERDAMYVESVDEVIKIMDDIYRKLRLNQMSPMVKGKSRERAFYAIAFAMSSTVSPGQFSFYDLVKQAMFNEANRMPMTRAEEILMAEPNKSIMVNLIKARLDVYALLALRGLTAKENITLWQRGQRVLYEATLGLFFSIDLPETFYTSTDITKDKVIEHLDEAAKIKNLLRELGISKDLEKRLRSAFMRIDLKAPKKFNRDEGELEEEELRLREREIQRLEARKEVIREKINNLLQ